MLQKILLAIGDSPESARVVESGLTLAEKLGAQVMLLHVLNPLLPLGFTTPSSPLVGGILPMVNDRAIAQYLEQWQEYERNGIARLQSYAQQAAERGIEAKICQNYGDSGPLICEAAKNWSADTIVMGRNQKSTFSEIFLGSTSNYVVHHAPCSVMVVRSPALSSSLDRQ
jgi:nucleotide-binding universal stress UspA family protein